jgi:hypothetical protein
VVLALAFTRVAPNLILTVRILDKTNHNAVLYERSVVDTPNVDRTLTQAELYAASGMLLNAGSDIQGAPWTSGSYVMLDVWQYNYDGRQPAAEATFDNLELWTYRVPITRYVDANSASPAPPYTNWATAARVIQDAVDAAQPGDTVLVTNGLYATGGRAVGDNLQVNRVAVDKPLTLRSVNGPEFTVIDGAGTVRCVYLGEGASVSGFTLAHGVGVGGGLRCESEAAIASNCVMVGNSGGQGGSGGGAYGGTLSHCTLRDNSAYIGGGAYLSTLNHCTLSGNSASAGGGAQECRLNHCTLSGNLAEGGGGGAADSTLNHCTLTGNSAHTGGGAIRCSLNACTLCGNSAQYGGGACVGTLNNCTLTGNYGGGALGHYWLGTCTVNNCIVYYNTDNGAPDGANYGYGSILNYSCTTPLPTNGVGNISLDPQLASATYLSASSPCREAGSAAYATGTDIDGEPWATPPSIGCDEYHAGAVEGPLNVGIAAAYTNAAVGFAVDLTALIAGRTTASVWDFGDDEVVSNRPYVSHAWNAPGDYGVVLRAYNDSYPAGVSATVTVQVLAEPVHYVAAGSTNPVPPYTSWATAATNIQDAVDAATFGGTVLVTNGLYATGGRAVYGTMTNRVAVYRALTVRSVNGPEFTVIQGYQMPGITNGEGAIRCVYLTNGASLSGFTLTRGATQSGPAVTDDRERCGGGVWCESINAVVSNCTLTGNSASEYGGGASGGTLNKCTLTGNSAWRAGGAYYATLNHCTLTGNSAAEGGGAIGGTLNNCTLTGNSAGYGGAAILGTLNNCTLTCNSATNGGGAVSSTLNNCIVYFNTAPDSANYDDYAHLNYCCTTPLPTNGVGNITNDPQLPDYVSDLRLTSDSPCINAGRNAYAPGPTDLDGNPRVVSGTVDIGAYEFQGPGSVISYAWLQQFGLPTDGSADAADPDTDGHNTWQEWHCQTDPTNALSVLRLLSATPHGTPQSGLTLTWQSVAGVNYFLECSTNLAATPRFTSLATNLPGQPGTTTYTDTNAVGAPSRFYRVGVSD